MFSEHSGSQFVQKQFKLASHSVCQCYPLREKYSNFSPEYWKFTPKIVARDAFKINKVLYRLELYHIWEHLHKVYLSIYPQNGQMPG